jgi:hypothetical protein
LDHSLQSKYPWKRGERAIENCKAHAYPPTKGLRMSHLDTNLEHAAMTKQMPARCQVIFDRHVFPYILHELQKYPTSEEGGKYIGYIDTDWQRRGSDRPHRIIITDFLPGGPRARRTAVEFVPDGDFQENLFREAEKRDPSIEHLGSWHSHHCNGLDRLSGGDIEGYFRTVNKRAYRPDLFVASLVKRLPRHGHDEDWIDHFLFVREEERFYKITNDVSIADAPTKFADITGHSRPSASPVTLWHETEFGRSVLADDKRLFAQLFGETLRATRKDGVITIRCGSEAKSFSVSYPRNPNDRSLEILVASGLRSIFTIVCDCDDRTVAYAASFHALDRL